MQWKLFGKIFFVPKFVMCLLGTVLGIGLILGGYFFLPQEDVFPTESFVMETQAQSIPTPTLWRIYIVGAVKKPGLYSLEQGALVYDAILAAGGLLPEADAQTINLAQELGSNFMVRILTETQRLEQGRESSLILIKNNVEVTGTGQIGTGTQEGKVNINSATKEELMTLSGIGEARAESIIAYREENGPFQTVEDIMLVNGIKESAFTKIKDRITT